MTAAPAEYFAALNVLGECGSSARELLIAYVQGDDRVPPRLYADLDDTELMLRWCIEVDRVRHGEENRAAPMIGLEFESALRGWRQEASV